MAIGDPYATLPELKAYTGATNTTYDNLLTDALAAASRGIESCTQRQFNTDASPTARTIPANRVLTTGVALLDDFHTTTGLVVETDDTGTGLLWQQWAANTYQVEPLDGVVDGRPGWPYTRIRAVDSRAFPQYTNGRAGLRVTARWGWATVPAPVKQACLMLAAEIYKTKDAPFGIAGVDNFGPVRVRENPAVMRKLAAYVRAPVMVA